MDKFNGRQYGYVGGAGDYYIENIPNQQVAGYPVGIVYIEQINYPLLPGNVVNAYSYDFPVRMAPVPNLTNTRLFDNDPTIADDIIATARHMVEKEGVRSICSACGFFGNYHKQVQEALDVPVAMSSLVQAPQILHLLNPKKKLGILTANAGSMTDNLLENSGLSSRDRLVIKDTRHTPNFANAVVDMSGYMDNTKAREEVVGLALEMQEENPDIGAILLECSDMPPYAAEIQAKTQLPVFDFITLKKWLRSGVNQRPHIGWI